MISTLFVEILVDFLDRGKHMNGFCVRFVHCHKKRENALKKI